MLFSGSAFAAGFMKLGDIKGEAIDKSNSTEVQSVRWMAPESLQKKNTTRRAHAVGGTVSVRKRIDKSSPKLAEMLNSGGDMDEIAIAEGGKQYLLKGVQIVSIEKQGKVEVVTLRFNHRQEFGPVQRGAANNHNTTRSNKTVAAPVSHNTTRSNRTKSVAADGADYNSSRSNKTH